MSFGNYNQSREIAALLCPLLRARSPKTPFRLIAADDDQMFSIAFKTLQMMGVRKPLFQSRRNYVIESTLFSEFCFERARSIIELHSTEPNEGAWTGGGEFKETSVSDSTMLGALYGAFGKEPPGSNALLQIDITGIWKDIAPLLEDGAVKLAARRQEHDRLREIKRKYEWAIRSEGNRPASSISVLGTAFPQSEEARKVKETYESAIRDARDKPASSINVFVPFP